MASPHPIIVTGRGGQVANVVVEGLKPEFEVIQVCLSLESAKSEIPLLLKGQEAPLESGIGTRNYAHPPIAVVTGAGYTDADVKEMMQACGGAEKDVPWLRPDVVKHSAGVGGPSQMPGPEYVKTIGPRAKKVLLEMMEKGEMVRGEFVLY